MQPVVQSVSARTGYGFATSFLGLDRCLKRALRALASHVLTFGMMLDRAGSTVPSITNGDAAEPPAAGEGEAGVVYLESDPADASHGDDTEGHASVAVMGIPDAAANDAPTTSPTNTAIDVAPTDNTLSAPVPATSCADTRPKAASTTAPHIKRTSTPRHPGTPRKASDSKSRTPTSSPPELVSSKSSPVSASSVSVTSVSDSDSPERRPKKVGFVEPLNSRRSMRSNREESKPGIFQYQPSKRVPTCRKGFSTFVFKHMGNRTHIPNKGFSYDNIYCAPSTSEGLSRKVSSTEYAHVKTSVEAEGKTSRLAWYSSMGISYGQDPTKYRQYIPTIEELAAFKKVSCAITATGDIFSMGRQLGRYGAVICNAYVTTCVLWL